MSATRITRITEKDHQRLQRLTEQTGLKQQEVITRALEEFEREFLLESINAAFEELHANPEEWQAELAERAAWDVTSTDRGADS